MKNIYFVLLLIIFISTSHALEGIQAKVLDVGGDFTVGHMEGGAVNENDLFYFTNTNKSSRSIYAIDLKNPRKGVKSICDTPAGGTWYANQQITFCVGKEAKVLQILSDGGNPKTLVKDSVNGKALLGPNDIVGDAHGGFYFTDKKGRAVYYINKDKKTSLVAAYDDNGNSEDDKLEELNNPNGIILSIDAKTLYVTDNSNILCAPLASPGKLKMPFRHLLKGEGVIEKSYMEMFGFKKSVKKVKKKTKVKWTAKFGGNLNIDGMTVDSKGVIYGAGLSAGIVYGWDPKTGKLIRVIHSPGSAVNCVVGKG